MNQIRLRRVRADDLRAYTGEDMPAELSSMEPAGWVAERDGRMIGLGAVAWDHYYRAWGWVSTREPLSAVVLHRHACRMLAMLREAGEPALYVFRDVNCATSERWLRRLGFVPAPELNGTQPLPVWKCDLTRVG